MTKTQKIIIAGLALIFIALLAGVGVMIWPDLTNLVFHPTGTPIVMPAAYVETSFYIETSLSVASPTEQTTPTVRIKMPTWTPIPSSTSFKLQTWTPIPTVTPIPARVVPSPIPVKPDCLAQYAYIESVHQYNLDYINYIYDLEVNSYQPLLQQAIRDRDAGTIIQIENEIKQINAQRDSDINAENSRYEADKAYLDAYCG
jgi:hypothetical protein